MTMAQMAVLNALHEGIPVTKISHKGDWHRRILTLSQDQCTLFITHARVDNEIHVSKLPRPMWTPSKGWKGSYQRYVDVADLLDVQIGVIGTETLELIKPSKWDEIRDSIVTIHHQQYLGSKSLNLLIENPSHRMALVGALATMRENYRDQQQWVGREILLLRYLWYDVDIDKNSMISEKEFVRICERINFYIPKLTKCFKEFLNENNIRGKELTYGECTKLISSLKGKQAVDDIWRRLFGTQVIVGPKKFHEKFLKMAQGEKKSTLKGAKDLILSLNTVELGEGSEPEHLFKLEKDRFEEYLRSEWNDAYDPKTRNMPKNGLTKPLSAYWVSSSHNTYLTGDQLRSKSSVGAYTNALLRGCKCLEIDVWDGPDRKGKLIPVVYHGHTMTSKIELESVLMVIKNYLFNHPDTYPIILSIENHCSIPFQEAMAKQIKHIFGVKLFIPSPSQRKVQMPSPEELKGMVVIKGKRPPEPDDDDGETGNAPKRDTEAFMDDLFDRFEPAPTPLSSRISTWVPQSFMIGSPDARQEQAQPRGKGKKNSTPEPVDQSFSKELLEITYFHGTKFKYFEESIELLPSHMHSINESKISKLVTQYDNNPDLWRQYNRTHMTRTYPAGTRVDSSNYNPILAWAMGCQLVSLNFQTRSTGMALNDGRFRQNGNCGYVAKPPSIMNPDKPPLPKKVKIRILSGSCLPKPRGDQWGEHIDPLVRVELHDVRMTKKGKEQFYTEKHATKRVDNNGFSPLFEDKGCAFVVQNPAVAMIVFRIMDADLGTDEQIASAAIPVSCLRKGFRSIQLYNESNARVGPYQYATLLAHIIH